MTDTETMDAPGLPPLLRGQPVMPEADPLHAAASAGARGDDPGLVVWSRDTARMRAAILLSPEVPLERAVAAGFAIALGFADALGALAPPETAVHFDWPGGIRVNGARCGCVRAAAPEVDPAAVPDWLAVGIEVTRLPIGAAEPGRAPEATTLFDEGCGDIGAGELISAWARHSLVWINHLVDDGIRPLHAAWRGHCDRIGAEIDRPAPGRFVGLDELGGLILAPSGGPTRVYPLTGILEPAR